MSPDAAGTEARSSAEVGRLARPALAWSFFNTIVGRLVTTVVGIVMARILVPEDYGVFAIAVVSLNALLSANELGVSLAVVRWPGDPRLIAPSVNAIAVSSSSCFVAIGMFLAPSIASWMHAPQATGVLRLLLLSALVDGVTSAPAGLLTRSFRQKTRALIDLANMTTTSAITITMGLLGMGAWSLACGQLAGNLLTAFAILRATRPYPGFAFDRVLWPQLLRFGVPLAAASGLVFVMLNVDYIVIGAVLGPVPLGIYFLAFNLASYPVAVISVTVRRVALAAFSRLEHDRDELASTFSRALRLLLAVALPGCTALALLAYQIITLVYGSKWAQAASVLTPLAMLSVVRIVTELTYDLLVSVGRTRRVLGIQATWVAALIPALLVGATVGGVRGVAVAHLLVAVTVALPLYLHAATRVGVPARSMARSAAPAVTAAAAVALVIVVLGVVVPDAIAFLVVGLLASALVALAIQWTTFGPFARSFLARSGPRQPSAT